VKGLSPLIAIVIALTFAGSALAQQSPESWRFAVSGDSRNCGDVVMPAIAQSVIQNQARFYWHLGDFRAMYGVDEDMQQRYSHQLPYPEYLQIAWTDFVESQIRPFAPVPVRLGIGNHEVMKNTPAEYLAHFGYWLDTPELRQQRLNDPVDTTLKPYYHWKERNVDFIYLDNSGDDAAFSDKQMEWFEALLARDKTDDEVKTVVVGMHRALPNSLACGHSMNGDAKTPTENGVKSGRRAYNDLLQWKHDTQNKKFVYILASHSHFYMQDLYDTKYWRNRGEVLPGWIVGTAGAMRYVLPDLPPEMLAKTKAETYVWGYLLGTVAPNGEIQFDFTKVGPDNVPQSVRDLYGDQWVYNTCFEGNRDPTKHDPPLSCKDE